MKPIQKAGVYIAVAGLAIALVGVLLIQYAPRDFEGLSSGVHTAGKVTIFAGLAVFLLTSVAGRHAPKLRRATGDRLKPPADWRRFWLRATLGSAVWASLCSLWLWPLASLFPTSALVALCHLGHWLGLLVFVFAGMGFVIASAMRTLATPMPVRAPMLPGPPPTEVRPE